MPNGRFALKVEDADAGFIYRSRLILSPDDATRPFWVAGVDPLAALISAEQQPQSQRMPRTFLPPPIELLSAEGRFAGLAHGAAWRRPIILVAREFCSFAWFESAAKGAAAGQAARLYARANAPYLNPGMMVRRAGQGSYGVWWWDEDSVARATSPARFGDARPPLAPETSAQPPGAAPWRIVRLPSGVRAAGLARPRARRLRPGGAPRPTAADWSAFTHGCSAIRGSAADRAASPGDAADRRGLHPDRVRAGAERLPRRPRSSRRGRRRRCWRSPRLSGRGRPCGSEAWRPTLSVRRGPCSR